MSSLEQAARLSHARRESARLAELARYDILDTAPEERFDRIVALARTLFDAPIATVTLVDQDRQWFKAGAAPGASETPREISFCSHVVALDDVLVVPDARADARFAHNPLVTGEPHIRFYAGAPIRSSTGANLGAMCVVSDTPRHGFSASDRDKLQMLSGIVETELELRLCSRRVQAVMSGAQIPLPEIQGRVRNSLEYSSAATDRAADMTPEKIAMLATAAWTQYAEAGSVLNAAVRALRGRMPEAEYDALLKAMPGLNG